MRCGSVACPRLWGWGRAAAKVLAAATSAILEALRIERNEMKRALTGLAALAMAASVAFAQHSVKDPNSAEGAFDRLKALVGSWDGKAGEGEEKVDTKVVYTLTGGGSALVETLFAGTGHQMTTVYFMNHGQLEMTHYCVMGNQPHMRMVPSTRPNMVVFDFVDGT